MTNNIIKYSLDQQTGKSMFIKNVLNGLSCNCICAKCGKKMVAVQGAEKEWHFRHHEDTDCIGGQETAIHKLAKQIIIDNSEMLIEKEVLLYSEARQEESFLSIIPDVTILSSGENVYFEIAVTHHVESSKENFYKNGFYKSIEIDLSNISYNITPNELEHIVLRDTSNKRKIFWSIEQSNKKTNSENFIWVILLAIGTFFLLFWRRKPRRNRR